MNRRDGNITGPRWWVGLQLAAQLAGTLMLVSFLFLVSVLILVSYYAEAPKPPELGLLMVLGITIGAVIVASALTAYVYDQFANQRSFQGRDRQAPTPGQVFRESTTRYTWLVSPIAAGYGLSQVVARIAELLVATPS